MEEGFFDRTKMLLGAGNMLKLSRARVAVFGLGGVGGYVVEALARSGVGAFELVDADRVSISNINRQIIATTESVGRLKTELFRERIRSINPDAVVDTRELFFLPETADSFDFTFYDYIVDAVDTVSAKIALAEAATRVRTPIISSMGAGNKLDPSALAVADIYHTSVCPLARVMRRELKKRGVSALKVVYSKEKPIVPSETGRGESMQIAATGRAVADTAAETEFGENAGSVTGSAAFVPGAAGLMIAAEVVRDLCG